MRALGKGSIATIIKIGLLIAWIALWVGAVCLLLISIAYGGLLAAIHAGMVDPTILTGGAGSAHGAGGTGDFHISYDTPNGGTWPVVVPVLLICAVAIGGALIIVWRLRKLIESFESGDPFRRENAVHLRAIWITMLTVELARLALMVLAGALIANFGGAIADNAEIRISGDRLAAWGSILIVMVLAEVFREGARLKEEQELTI